MKNIAKTKDELLQELNALKQEYATLKIKYEKDIYEHLTTKEVEVTLKKSEECFRMIFENAPVMIDAFNKDGNCTMWNKECEKTFGWTIEEINSYDEPLSLFYPDPKIKEQVIATIISSPEKIFREWHPHTKDGTVLSCLWANFRLPDETVMNLGYNITESNRAEEALRKSELRFKQISENAQESIWEVDNNGLYTYVSSNIKELLGYEAEEIVGIKYFYDFFDPENKEDLKQAALGAFARKESFKNFINCNIHKNGKKIILSTSCIPMLDNENNLIGYRGVDIDITERKLAEETLLKSKLQYDNLVSKIPVGIYILHTMLEGTFVLDYVSPKMADMFNVSVESLLADSQIVIQSIHPDDRDNFVKLNQEGIRLRRPFDWKGRVLTAKGVKWLHLESSPEPQENGEILWHGLAVDITERKLAEELLKSSEEKYRTLFENIPIGIGVGDLTGKIITFNDSMLKPGGYSRDDIIKMGNLENLYYNFSDRATIISLVKEKEFVNQYPVKFKRKDGSAYDTLLSLSRININGQPRIQALVEDITERKRIEEALHESEANTRAILEAMSTGILIIDPETHTIVDLNSVTSKMIGEPKEKIVGRVCHQFICPAENEKCPVTDLEQVVDNSERVLLNKEGIRIPILKTVSQITMGERKLLIENFTDITELKRVEKELKESENKFRTVIEEAVEIVFIVNNRGYFTYVNPSGSKSSGYSLDELKQLKYIDLIEPEHKKRVTRNYLRQYLERKSISTTEYPFRTKSGEIKWFNQNVRLIIENNEVTGFYVIARDITELRKAEIALKDSEVKLNVILESIADGILAVDSKGKIIKTNKKFAELWQIPQSIIDSGDDNTLLNFILEQLVDAEAFISKVQKLYNSTDEDLDLVHFKDGRIFERFSTPYLMQDSSIGRVWSFHDITKRKQAEETLKNERLLLRTLIDHIPDSIYSKDLACRKTLVNLTDLRYSGAKSEAEILGKTDFDLYPKELAEKFIADDQSVMQSGKPVLNKEEYVIDENGHQRWLLTSKLPLKDEKGNITGIVGIGRDITDRKNAEEEIQKHNEQFRLVWNGSLDGMRIMDEKGKIVMVNEAFCNMIGLERQQLEGEHLSVLFHKSINEISDPNEQNSKMDVYKQRFYDKKIEPKFERELHLWDDRKVWFEVTNAYMEIEGGKNVLLSIFRDISVRKLSELIIQQQNNQLQELNASKDKFFSIIAHDLKSPFQGFLNLTKIMATESQDFTISEFAEFSQALNESAVNLYKLLENLLDWATIQQGKKPFNLQRLNLKTMVTQNISTNMDRAKQKGISIINQVEDSINVSADEQMINTVLRNLISNAVKFTRKDGTITVNAKPIENEMIEISVIDTGIGISDKDLKRLFKIGEQVSSKGTEGESSTGLGLLLSKEFVEKHNGNIWVDSKENVGSTFYFTLPKII
ncbi:MAG: PAS domain S-box protein [Ignavibacteriales bacterium]|nr:PAS domain S-box protein [Ignavibacteriales bacterium]